MDDKNIYTSFCLSNESSTLDKIEELGKNSFQQLQSRKTAICSVMNLEKVLVFDYGYTIKLLLTTYEAHTGKNSDSSFSYGSHEEHIITSKSKHTNF